jgi:GTP-binding protein LepA
VIQAIPAPSGNDNNPLETLIFDSSFDIYKGVIIYGRLFNGKIALGDTIRMMQADKVYTIEEIGVFRPQMTPAKACAAAKSATSQLISGIRKKS